MEVPEYVLVVSLEYDPRIGIYILIFLTVDFALTEAAYTVVRLLHKFPTIRLPAGHKIELTGVEKQTMTLVLSSTEGCMVDFGSKEEQRQYY